MKLDHESPTAIPLADVQNSLDTRQIPIDRVGVRRVKYPILVALEDGSTQQTLATFTLLVDLPQEYKGTHMSRFLEVLGEQEGPLNRSVIQELLKKLKARLRSQCARLEVKFQIFAEKAAPVTEKVGYMAYECGFEAHTDSIDGFHMLLQCPISTVCPCSKEISDYGAHNQRGLVSVKVNPTGELGFEQLIQAIEASGSAPLYPVLKREDEKFVTELAYNNPRFVEDVVREVAGRFDQIEAIHSYQIEVENYESIHDHNAYAFIERTK